MAGGAIVAQGGDAYAHLIDPKKTWYNNSRLMLLNAWIFLFLITSATNGYDGSMMNGLQSLTQWTSFFDHPSASQLGLLNSIQGIGGLLALPFAPYCSDGLGRRYTVALGAVLMVGATAMQTASQTVSVFVAARFLIGFGCTFAANAAPMLVTELAYPPYRAQLTSTYNSLWYLGAIIAAWTTFGTFKIDNTWSWRIPSVLQALPSLAQLIFIWWAPESPRWLVSKGRDQEALDVLAYYHANGRQDDPLVQQEFNEMKGTIGDASKEDNSSWKALFGTVGNRKRVTVIAAIAFFSQWSGNGIASYYLNMILKAVGIEDSNEQLLINGVLQIWNFAWALFAAGMVDKAGRRTLFLISGVGMLVFFSGQTICYALFVEESNKMAGHGVIGFIFLYYAAYDLAFTPLLVSYTVEILPFSLRAKGLNILGLTVSLAAISNQYINPVALDALGWRYYIVYVAWIACECVFLYLFIIETKGLSLEETAVLFDGGSSAKDTEKAFNMGIALDGNGAVAVHRQSGVSVGHQRGVSFHRKSASAQRGVSLQLSADNSSDDEINLKGQTLPPVSEYDVDDSLKGNFIGDGASSRTMLVDPSERKAI
ncbi:hexose transporter [Cylindrobasidium torrendii FP15055 ss-10]|uniref:Hexose transporter n=1 Tax=Cylindrobasidium torrendii FP15055 ss-10 TaxID=1314674 RepID=A0A0D7B4X5_9AGAR|nr:hexose transporter [Cylindrobasidium torrendii FP15055 ss-10]